MQNSLNETKLNEIIQKVAANPLFWKRSGEVTITHGKRVWTRSDGFRDIINWQNQLMEEAYNRILIHVKDMVIQNFPNKNS